MLIGVLAPPPITHLSEKEEKFKQFNHSLLSFDKSSINKIKLKNNDKDVTVFLKIL